jgi:histone H1/5
MNALSKLQAQWEALYIEYLRSQNSGTRADISVAPTDMTKAAKAAKLKKPTNAKSAKIPKMTSTKADKNSNMTKKTTNTAKELLKPYICTKLAQNFNCSNMADVAVTSVEPPKFTKTTKAPAEKAKAPETVEVPNASKLKVPAAHPDLMEMIHAAIVALKEPNGSSRRAIVNYIMANYNVGTDQKAITSSVKDALKSSIQKGLLKAIPKVDDKRATEAPQAAEDQKANSPMRTEASEAKAPKTTEAKKPTTAKRAKSSKKKSTNSNKKSRNADKKSATDKNSKMPKKKAAKKATNSKMNDTSKGARTPKITTAKKATEAKKNPTKKVGNCAIHENFPFDRGKKKGSDSPIQTFIVPFLKFHLQNSLVFMPYLTHFQKQNFMLHPYQQLKEEKREKGDVSIPFISPFIFCVFIIIIIDYIPFR